jgi:putative oxygen-independent coproporphyrinogen III oxidase
MATDGAPFSLYIHIPYCMSKCPYCDFNSHVVSEIPEGTYTEALLKELDWYGATSDWQKRTVQSIFFGGGTPSTFQPQSIGRILEKTSAVLSIDSQCEITLEANPGTVDRQKFFGYRACGVNRISIGVQSFQPRLLKFLGRIHSADDAKKALEVVTMASFDNFSLDLIYANPGQTLGQLEADLETALSFLPPHLSAYNLTFEEGTPFHHELRSGRVHPLAEDDEITMGGLIEERLGTAGLQRYEISNYARSGFHSRHNVNYWNSGDYLGLGAGAHSYTAVKQNGFYGRRWWNEKNPARYMNNVQSTGAAVVGREDTDLHTAAGEFMFSGLRLIDGVSSAAFERRFGQKPTQFFPQITDWVNDGLMEERAARLRLTSRGLMLANSLFVHFV